MATTQYVHEANQPDSDNDYSRDIMEIQNNPIQTSGIKNTTVDKVGDNNNCVSMNGVNNNESLNSVDAENSEGISNKVEVDYWDVHEEESNEPVWKDLAAPQKVLRVVVILIKVVLILCCLYLFICSLDCLQNAFQLLSGRSAGNLFSNSVLMNNPVSAMMIGVFVTVLVQSSSTSTSIVVTLVGSNILNVKQSIPLIMGSNIGTTVTNTIVALTQSANKDIFRRAFAGATVHDAFNWLSVILLLPLEVASGYLYYLSNLISVNVHPVQNTDNPQFLKVITKPLTKLIIQIDKKVITAVAKGTDRQRLPLVQYWKKMVTIERYLELPMNDFDQTHQDILDEPFNHNIVHHQNNVTNMSFINYTEVDANKSIRASHLFSGIGMEGYISEAAGGIILIFASLAAMTICLILLVKILTSLFKGPMTTILRKGLNAEFPGRFSFLTGYVVMMVGTLVTILFQSSSVFTSAITPLIGIGLITIERAYPITLGSNIGTTVTAILAAFTADPDYIQQTVQISMCHLFFNISGILIFYPLPFMRIPIPIAKKLGDTTAKYRWFPFFYLVSMFGILPLTVFGLSLTPHAIGLIVIGSPLLLLLLLIFILNILQSKKPNWLPQKLQNWKFLPKPMRSLGFYDQYIRKLTKKLKCCKKCSNNNDIRGEESTGEQIENVNPKNKDIKKKNDVECSGGVSGKGVVNRKNEQSGHDNNAYQPAEEVTDDLLSSGFGESTKI